MELNMFFRKEVLNHCPRTQTVDIGQLKKVMSKTSSSTGQHGSQTSGLSHCEAMKKIFAA